MPDLFLTPPRIDPAEYGVKVSSYTISSAPGYWDDEVSTLLAKEHPYIPSDRLIVTFKKKDDAEGSAQGYATIAGNPRLSIPIIMNQRKLSPMDVLIIRSGKDEGTQEGTGDMSEDTVLPLTEENFSKALDTGPVGDVMDPNEDRSSGATEDGSNLRMPFRGRTVLAEYLGASPAKLAEFEAQLNATNLTGFSLNGTESVVDQWLAASGPKKTAQAIFGAQVLPSHPVSFANQIPATVKTADILAAEIFANESEIKTAIAVDVFDLAAPTKGTSRVLIYEDGTYTRAPDQVVVASVNENMAGDVIAKIAAKDLCRGNNYMFQIDDGFLSPAKLASIGVDETSQVVKLELSDDLGRLYPVLLDRRVKTATLSDKTWIVPMGASVFQLGNYVEGPTSPVKVAEWLDRQLPDSLTYSDGQFSLSIRGQQFGTAQVNQAKIAEVLDGWFSNGAELLAKAKAEGAVRFDSQLPSQVKAAEKLASVYQKLPEMAREVVADIGMPMDKAVKLAAGLGDPQGVDAVLSSGFLNEDNLSEFSGLADRFEEIVGKLARLLLAIRMGFPGDENATLVAMKSLSRVAEKLRASSDPSTGLRG